MFNIYSQRPASYELKKIDHTGAADMDSGQTLEEAIEAAIGIGDGETMFSVVSRLTTSGYGQLVSFIRAAGERHNAEIEARWAGRL